MADVIEREAARVLLLNPRQELLLFAMSTSFARHPKPGAEWCWMTPGGGREPGESWEATAHRELWEETGLASVTLGPWVWEIEHRIVDDGVRRRHRDRFVIVRVDSDEISLANQYEYERSTYEQYRWWSLEAMQASPDLFFPIGLADFLAPLLNGSIPDQPVTLPSDLIDW